MSSPRGGVVLEHAHRPRPYKSINLGIQNLPRVLTLAVDRSGKRRGFRSALWPTDARKRIRVGNGLRVQVRHQALTKCRHEAINSTARDFLATIPGVSLRAAEVIIAETGADMSVFETPGRLASWAGVCPGSNESAGRVKSTHILPGNKYLKAVLGTAALSASRSKNTYLAAKYRRITARRGPMKAIVALEHSILNAVWHMLAEGECYEDPGPDLFIRLDPVKAKNNAIKKLNSLGFDVTITPAPAA